MAKNNTSKKNRPKAQIFNQLLNWLGENSVESAEQYKFIHNKLIMYFAARGCAEAEDLADITIDRVSQKVSSSDFKFTGTKMKYFYSFAKNIHFEYLKKRNLQLNEEILSDNDYSFDETDVEEISIDQEQLRVCLSKLNRNDKSLLLKYYSGKSGREKEFREKIATKYKIPTNSLRVKIFRLKQSLIECIEKNNKN